MTDIDIYQDRSLALPAETGGASSIVAWARAASDAARLVSPLVKTEFVPQHFRGNVEAATAAVLYGAEAGLSPLQALQGVYVISGRPAMYARTMLAIAQSRGHDVWTEDLTDTRAVVCARRKGSQHVERIVWTLDRARKAGYTKNAKYGSDPQVMLLARAQSDAVRRVAADALLGMAYSVEELEDEAAPPEQTTTVQRGGGGKRAAQRRQPAPQPEPDLDAKPTAESEPQPEPTEPTPGNITQAQSRKMHALFNEQGITDRDDRLAWVAGVIGRQVESSSDLTKAEAGQVIDALESVTLQLPEGAE